MGRHAAHLLHFPGRMYCTFVDERGVNIQTAPRLLASPCGLESRVEGLGRIGIGDYGLGSRGCNWPASRAGGPRMVETSTYRRLVDRLNRDPSGSPTCSHMKTNAKPPTLSSRSTTAEIRMLKPAADHDCIVWRAWPRRVILDGRAPDRPGPDD